MAEGPVLPIRVHNGNLSLDRPVIRRISDQPKAAIDRIDTRHLKWRIPMKLRAVCAQGYSLPRRDVLTGLVTFASVAPFTSAAAGAELRISNLIDGDGAVLPRARALVGNRVRLRGYLATALAPDQQGYRLTESPAGPCQLCGAVHDTGAALRVTPAADGAFDAVGLEPVDVSGHLEAAEQFAQLTDARIELG